MGAIGGMGIGTGTGTSTAVLGKMRELAEIGYEKKMFDLYQKVKQGEKNPILETQSDISAQFADLLDPKIGRDFVWVDQQNYGEFGQILSDGGFPILLHFSLLSISIGHKLVEHHSDIEHNSIS